MKLSMISLASVLGLATLVGATGCSKPSPEQQKKNEEALASALASALAAPSSAPTLNSAPAAAAGGGISATCNKKDDGKCTETLGAPGLGAEDSCKMLGGVYTKGNTPCAKENLLGTCTRADATSGLNDIDYYYKHSGADADIMKSLCEEVMSGKWAAAAPAAGKGSAAAPAKGAAPTAPAKKK